MNDLGDKLFEVKSIFFQTHHKTSSSNSRQNSNNDLEDWFREFLINEVFISEKSKDDPKIAKFLKDYKKQIQSISNDSEILNPFNESFFVRQPFGSQQFPDYLIFNKMVISLELKSTKKTTHPAINGGLFKKSGIYIFANYTKHIINFFSGKDVLDDTMISAFEKIDNVRVNSNNTYLKLGIPGKFQIKAYFRKTYNLSGIPVNEWSDIDKIENRIKKELNNS